MSVALSAELWCCEHRERTIAISCMGRKNILRHEIHEKPKRKDSAPRSFRKGMHEK